MKQELPKDEQVEILLSRSEANELYEILCALPFRPANSYDNEPPTEREEPVEEVLDQISQQLGLGEDY